MSVSTTCAVSLLTCLNPRRLRMSTHQSTICCISIGRQPSVPSRPPSNMCSCSVAGAWPSGHPDRGCFEGRMTCRSRSAVSCIHAISNFIVQGVVGVDGCDGTASVMLSWSGGSSNCKRCGRRGWWSRPHLALALTLHAMGAGLGTVGTVGTGSMSTEGRPRGSVPSCNAVGCI